MDSAIVVGAGIGGLTAAAALQRVDCDVTILERAPELVPVGAGLTIQPNAVRALRGLGLAEPLLEVGARLRAPELRDSRGRLLAALSGEESDRLMAAARAPALGVHRATVQRVLLDALAPGTDLRLGAEVVGLTPEGDGVRLADGSEVSADIVVGADGLRSSIRASLLGAEPPRYSGYYCWRGVVARAALADMWPGGRAAGAGSAGGADEAWPGEHWAAEYWGAGVRFGGCAIDGDRVYWYATRNGAAGETDGTRYTAGETAGTRNTGGETAGTRSTAGETDGTRNTAGGVAPDGAKRAASAALADFPPEVRAIVAATDEAAVFRTDIHDRDPATAWGAGAATLLGDAAHPMTPNLGQGACQAIVDALALALVVDSMGARPAALREYERRRIPRTAKVVRAARRAGDIGQWARPTQVRLRDTAARLTPTKALERQFSSLWG